MIEMTFLEWLMFVQKPKNEQEDWIVNNSYITPIM